MIHLINSQSKWKTNLKHEHHDSGSDTLMVLLPGAGYTIEGPLFYYLIGLSYKLAYDVVGINYGYQLSQDKIDIQSELSHIEVEIRDVLDQIRPYKRLIYIGKSMGTYFIDRLRKQDTCVYITPTNWTMPDQIKDNTFFIYGDMDKALDEKNKKRLYENTYIVSGANHGLVCHDVYDSIDKIKLIIDAVETFIT